MLGEVVIGVAMLVVGLIVSFLIYLNENVKKEESTLDKEDLKPPPMRQGDGKRVPLQERVQPIKPAATTTTGRSDTAYGYPVIDQDTSNEGEKH